MKLLALLLLAGSLVAAEPDLLATLRTEALAKIELEGAGEDQKRAADAAIFAYSRAVLLSIDTSPAPVPTEANADEGDAEFAIRLQRRKRFNSFLAEIAAALKKDTQPYDLIGLHHRLATYAEAYLAAKGKEVPLPVGHR